VTHRRRHSPTASRACRLAVVNLALLPILTAGCSPAPTPSPGPIQTASIVAPVSGTPTPSDAPSTSPVTGVLIDIDAAGLSQVTAFTLRLDDGRQLTFRIGTLENGAEFPPGHLAEHLATSSPVRVFFRREGPALVAYRLEDAG